MAYQIGEDLFRRELHRISHGIVDARRGEESPDEIEDLRQFTDIPAEGR